MIVIRESAARGRTDLGWLDSRHTFSFGGYHDAGHMGFGSLRVINEDRVTAGGGFGTHGHRDMEILSYVLEGELAHRDSLGTGSVIRPGELQRMSAGTGILHSEFNQSKTRPVHFLQIWILPESSGLAPGYEQRAFERDGHRNRLKLIADRHGSDGAVTVHQDIRLYAADLEPGHVLTHAFAPRRAGWLQVTAGRVLLGPHTLEAGAGAAIRDEAEIGLTTPSGAGLLVFDLG